MEKEKLTSEKVIPRTTRKVSLFKKRKKADIRPFVREKKKIKNKKFVSRLLVVFIVLFILGFALFLIRYIAIPHFNIASREKIVDPQANQLPDNNQVLNIFLKRDIDFSDVQFATSSSQIVFLLHKNTKVIITNEKDIDLQLDLVEAIDEQLSSEDKQAISIDLRYNKPIVKF